MIGFQLSEMSGIPAEFIETGKAPGSFPSVDYWILTPHTEIEWCTAGSKTSSDDSVLSLYDESHLIFYRYLN